MSSQKKTKKLYTGKEEQQQNGLAKVSGHAQDLLWRYQSDCTLKRTNRKYCGNRFQQGFLEMLNSTCIHGGEGKEM